jgi:hypothetical protein
MHNRTSRSRTIARTYFFFAAFRAANFFALAPMGAFLSFVFFLPFVALATFTGIRFFRVSDFSSA